MQPSTAFVRVGWEKKSQEPTIEHLVAASTSTDTEDTLAGNPIQQSDEEQVLDACSHYATPQSSCDSMNISMLSIRSVIQMDLILDPYRRTLIRPPLRA